MEHLKGSFQQKNCSNADDMMEAQGVTWEAGVPWVGRVCKKRKRCIIAANIANIISIVISVNMNTIDIKISIGVQETVLYNSLVTIISLDIFSCPEEIEETRWLTIMMMMIIKK